MSTSQFGEFRSFAVQRILEIMAQENGRPVARERMKREVLESYSLHFGKIAEIDQKIEGQGRTLGENWLSWARKLLSGKILVPEADSSNGDYVLAVGTVEFAKSLASTNEQDLVHLVRQLRDSDAVYVVEDPRHPGWLKIGCGIGDCRDRIREAKLWTRYEAKLIHREDVGFARGWSIEQETHRTLRQQQVVSTGEWFCCSLEKVIQSILVVRETIEASARRSAPGGVE